MRLIDADAVPQEFWDYEFDGKWSGCTIKDLLDSQPTVHPEPQWIPCSERLPEAGVRYQVTFESGEVGYADFRNKIFLWDGSAKENVWETERYYEDDGEVIAWMPRPECYRGEKNGDNNLFSE